MSARKRSREGDPYGCLLDLLEAKKQLFSLESQTEAPCVCAFDFGTARSGIAYAFTRRPDEIKIKEPGGQEPGKTRTSLLLDQRGSFLAFGSKAREDYYEWDQTGMLFEGFKMRLHDSHDASTPLAYALNGKSIPLVKVITLSLEYLKNEAMQEINRSQPKALSAHEIKWVVTVPAIWRDVAKGMMRKAAFDAGMISEEDSERLVLCLEPEAACLACEDQRLSGQGAAAQVLQLRDRFMVLDCGGGTVDITMHEVEATQPLTLSEIREPSGGPWGSTLIDAEFEEFLRKLIGEESWKAFKPSSAWVDLMEAWEETKLRFDPSEMQDDSATPVRLNLAALVGDGVLGDRTLQSCVDSYNRRQGGNLTLRRGTTILMPLLQASCLFKTVIGKIITHVKDLLAETPVRYIYLVGGFAESKMLQTRVKAEFENSRLHVIVPMRPQLMVVKGAVLFGLQKGGAIQSRVARYTYGTSVSTPYDPTNVGHLLRGFFEAKQMDGKTKKYVRDGFQALVKQGTSIRVSESHSSAGFSPVGVDQTKVSFVLYSSTDPAAKFVDQPCMKRIGEVEIPCSFGQSSSISMRFGSTEISATAENESTREKRKARIKYNFNSL